MGLGLQGTYGAQGGADALQQMIADRLKQEELKRQIAQQQTENTQKDRQIGVQEANQQSLEQQRRDSVAESTRNNKVNGALRLAPLLKPGQTVQPADAQNFQDAGMGSLIQHALPQPGNTEMSGMATAPSLKTGSGAGYLRTQTNAPQNARDVFTGTQGQDDAQAGLAARQAALDETRRRDDMTNQIAQVRAEATANKPDHSNDTRMDRSYQFHRAALDKLAAPLEQQAQRMGRLIETVNQHTPQADALVAPELLTVMAGGVGSGIRINEAEIQRVVGGRSNFESLKAALNKWQADPSKALSITEPQRAQIRDLIAAVHDKSQAQLAIVNKAGDALIDAPDVVSHRRILGDARRQIQDSSEAVQGDGTTKPGGGVTITSIRQVK